MKKTLISTIMLLLVLGLVGAVPSIPNVFKGDVTYSENPSLSLKGAGIAASIGVYDLGIIGEVQSGNSYEVMVDPEGRSGTITFYIGGVEATPTATYEMGAFTELDLTVDKKPTEGYCGNDQRDIGEQCDGIDLNDRTCTDVMGAGWSGEISCNEFCSFDITACTYTEPSTPAPSGGSSGGGGGGGYVAPTQVVEENETEEPEEEPVKVVTSSQEEEEDNPYVVITPSNQQSTDTKSDGSNALTGAVTGIGEGNTSLFIILLVSFFVLLTGVVVYLWKTKKLF